MSDESKHERTDEFDNNGNHFNEPIDEAAEKAMLERLHRRNLKRIFIPMALVIALSIVLGMIGPPKSGTDSPIESDSASQSRDP